MAVPQRMCIHCHCLDDSIKVGPFMFYIKTCTASSFQTFANSVCGSALHRLVHTTLNDARGPYQLISSNRQNGDI